jgi:hypothetical protein
VKSSALKLANQQETEDEQETPESCLELQGEGEAGGDETEGDIKLAVKAHPHNLDAMLQARRFVSRAYQFRVVR